MKTATPSGREPSAFGIGKLLLALVLAVLFLLLGHSMVRHRFFLKAAGNTGTAPWGNEQKRHPEKT